MSNMYHIVIGSIAPVGLFEHSEDENRMKDYIRLYKNRTGIENYGYSFTNHRLHLALRDKQHQLRAFLQGVCDAYAYYYASRRQREVRISYKINPIKPRHELFDLLRFIHRRGRNSARDYRDYSRYLPNELVDIAPILATLHHDQLIGKEMFFEEMVRESEAGYYTAYAEREIFELDKMTKRRQRAFEFMEDYLSEVGLSRQELLESHQEYHRIELIERFRKETDLSYRDIGHVFGLSHTSIIRLHQRKNRPV